jgi:hypothetical protein
MGRLFQSAGAVRYKDRTVTLKRKALQEQIRVTTEDKQVELEL